MIAQMIILFQHNLKVLLYFAICYLQLNMLNMPLQIHFSILSHLFLLIWIQYQNKFSLHFQILDSSISLMSYPTYLSPLVIYNQILQYHNITVRFGCQLPNLILNNQKLIH